VMKKYNALDFSKLAAWDLMQHYQDFEQTLLKKWKAPLVNDFFTMIFYGSMQKLAVKYKLDEAGTLHNDLLCGARDIVSTEPIHRCYRMAQLINADLRLRQLFMEQDELFIVREIRSGKFPELHDQFNEYINDWGDRTVGELKLETITYRQEPALLVRVLKGFIGQQQQHKDHDLKIRKEAENIVSEKLRKKPIRKWIFSYFLRKSRDLVTNRENLRFARTRGFGLVRRIFIAIGENFYSEGLLSHPRDIFMLKKEEIFDFIQGTSDTPNLRALVTLRKKEYAVFENKMTSERIATHGIVYAGNDFSLQSNELSFPANGKATLKGIGCCPGKIRARVRIVHDPYSLNSLQGDILVTASTDPGWITLFPSASAILVERGSLLSHSAIVSRELGKPCIVGITGLLQKLQTGDLVEMDGSTGEILIIENECAD
ncbi:MAG TPA: PEP-utilizing enzyme, partial [Bacteroidia bacterium]|nr:PEP-utilizing enzyme [Bacteroidia bacterium]